MHTTNLRKVGGSDMLAVPPALLDRSATATWGQSWHTGVVRCDQPRALDLSARGGKKLEDIPDKIMNEVLARLSPIFE